MRNKFGKPARPRRATGLMLVFARSVRVSALKSAAMMNNEISPEVRHFMSTSIPSIPHLEALMLARASAPGRWSAPSLSERLYISRERAAGVLADLQRTGLLLCDPAASSYVYQRPPHPLHAIIEQLAILYACNLVGITELIHSKTARAPQQPAGGDNVQDPEQA